MPSSREHARLVVERKLSAIAVFRVYMAKHHPFTDVMSSGLDFCGFEPVKTMLEQPTEVIIDETSFADVVPLIPNFIADWRESLDRRLMEVIEEGKHYLCLNRNEFGELVEGNDNEDAIEDEKNTSVQGNTRKTRRGYLQPPPQDENAELKLATTTTVFQCRNCLLKHPTALALEDIHDYNSKDEFYVDNFDQLPLPGALFFRSWA
ncbi:hypothetical protein C0989_003208 [Termitomyces sp. Mn162]|nr:hypothetical protein C0989_003208 [Termitomyces sp. Mn162]